MTQHNKIALVGKLHSGKSTVASTLVELGYNQLALAEPVKQASVAMINAFYRFMDMPETMTRQDLERDKDELRGLPQWVGTELGRDYLGDDKIWINYFLKQVQFLEGMSAQGKREVKVVCDDCRFLNEAAALRSQGFTLVKIVRDEVARVASVRNKVKSGMLTGIGYYKFSQMPADEFEALLDAKIQKMLNHPSELDIDLIEADFSVASTDVDRLKQIGLELAGWPVQTGELVAAA